MDNSGVRATPRTVCFPVVEALREMVDAGLLERSRLQDAATHLTATMHRAFDQALSSLPQLKAARADVPAPAAEPAGHPADGPLPSEEPGAGPGDVPDPDTVGSGTRAGRTRTGPRPEAGTAFLDAPRAAPRLALDETRLRTLVDAVAAEHRLPDGAAGLPPENCVSLLRHLERRLHPGLFSGGPARWEPPSGVRAGTALDDLAVGTGRAADSLTAGRGWGRVGTSWEPLLSSVADQGVGTTALVLVHRPGGLIGHALALHQTTDGPRWIELQGPAGDRVHAAVPGGLSPAHARAVLIDAAGRVVGHGLPDWQESDSTAVASMDAPGDRRYGAAGAGTGGTSPRRFPPARITRYGRLAASDLVLSLTQEAAGTAEVVEAVLRPVFGDDLPAARTTFEQFFSPDTLRPLLAALTRGERWAAEFTGGGWSGEVSVTARVRDLEYRETLAKVEFDTGSGRQGAAEHFEDRRRRVQGGVQGRLTLGSWTLSAPFALIDERLTATRRSEAARIIARGKTVAPGGRFEGKVDLTFDFSRLTRHRKPLRTEPVDVPGIGVSVVVPIHDTVDAEGRHPVFGEPVAPPPRLAAGRIGSSDIVTDVAPADPEAPDPVPGLLDSLDAEGRAFFGPAWAQVRAKMAATLTLTGLQQGIRGMTAGEPMTFEVPGATGGLAALVEVTARVKEARQSGETGATEFNVGTGIVRSHARGDLTSGAVQLPGQFNASSINGDPVLAGGGAYVQFGRDRGRSSRTVHELGTTTKTKKPGAYFDCTAALRFDMWEGVPQRGARTHRAERDIALTVLVEKEGPGAAPAPGSEVPGPPRTVWDPVHGGLNDRVTVRDLWRIARLRRRIDEIGRQALGAAWDESRGPVLAVFGQQHVAARLTAMTRGEPLRAVVGGLGLSATARVVEMTYSGTEEKAELNTVKETTTTDASQRLWSDSRAAQGALGGAGTLDAAGDTLGAAATAAVEWRRRQGARYGWSGKVVANGKSPVPQAVFTARIAVDVTGDGGPVSTVELMAEISMDERETERHTVGPDGVAVFTPASEGRRREDRPRGDLVAPPDRLTNRRALGGSDVVHSMGPEALRVLERIEAELARRFTTVPDDVRVRLQERFDPFALAAELSALSRGAEIRAELPVRGRRVTVVVRAELLPDFRHTETVEKFEFESGTQHRTFSGAAQDDWRRMRGGALVRAKVPYASVLGGYQYLKDRSRRTAVESAAGTSARSKWVTRAELFTGRASFSVSVEEHGLLGRRPAPPHQVQVTTTIAVPGHDTGTGPAVKRGWPKRIADTMRLGDSDVVTDVFMLDPPGPATTAVEEMIRPIEHRGASVLGGDWAEVRRKIVRELEVNRLHTRLKPMMAGHRIVVGHGRSTVRISAAVSRLDHVADTDGNPEFNSGTGLQRVFASQNNNATEGSGKGHAVSGGFLAAVGPLDPGPALAVGGSATYSRGSDRQDGEVRSTGSGVTVKTKRPAHVYSGEATLIFDFERDPVLDLGRDRIVPGPPAAHEGPGHALAAWPGAVWRSLRRIGTAQRTMATARIGFTAMVEKGDALPLRQPRPEPAAPPQPADVAIPPDRVWRAADGLRDTDVLRWLGDSSGVQDILRTVGPEFFGKRTWGRIGELARHTVDQPRLAAHLNLAPGGQELRTPAPRRRALEAETEVRVGFRLVSLRFRDFDTGAELSPANETSSNRTRTQLHWDSAAGQFELGAKAGLGAADGTLTATAGVERRTRHGSAQADTGQVFSHAKFPQKLARYDGFAKVTLTFVDGARVRQEHGLVPVAVDIPQQDTEIVPVTGDRLPVVFTPERTRGGLAEPEDAHAGAPGTDVAGHDVAGHDAATPPRPAPDHGPGTDPTALTAPPLQGASAHGAADPATVPPRPRTPEAERAGTAGTRAADTTATAPGPHSRSAGGPDATATGDRGTGDRGTGDRGAGAPRSTPLRAPQAADTPSSEPAPPTGPADRSAAPPETLDERFGPAVPPKRVKPEERYPLSGTVRPNPLWTRLEDLDPARLTASEDAVWLFTVTEAGDVVLGSEKVTGILTPEEFDQLHAGIRRREPDLTADQLRARLDGLGHTGLALHFTDDTPHNEGRARVSGEFRWSPEHRSWAVNDKSGRYMSTQVRPGVDPRDAARWLANAAQLLSAHIGAPVAAVQTKSAAAKAPAVTAPAATAPEVTAPAATAPEVTAPAVTAPAAGATAPVTQQPLVEAYRDLAWAERAWDKLPSDDQTDQVHHEVLAMVGAQVELPLRIGDDTPFAQLSVGERLARALTVHVLRGRLRLGPADQSQPQSDQAPAPGGAAAVPDVRSFLANLTEVESRPLPRPRPRLRAGARTLPAGGLAPGAASPAPADTGSHSVDLDVSELFAIHTDALDHADPESPRHVGAGLARDIERVLAVRSLIAGETVIRLRRPHAVSTVAASQVVHHAVLALGAGLYLELAPGAVIHICPPV
ncbi:hypothetical protein [Streptomyces sp. NPDC001380]|uniref:hypothetical protein n=1 Tax=Streptomyces sp. NPDC001380 TaxID=3364566 RepID=UPI0036CD0D9E